MTRYIDADALKEWFPDNGEGSWTYNVIVKACIDAQPTIDAIPVEWILNNERMPKEGKGHDAIMDMIADWRKENDRNS